MPKVLIKKSTSSNLTTNINLRPKTLDVLQYPTNLLTDYVDHIDIKTYQYTSLTEYFNYNSIEIFKNINTSPNQSFDLSRFITGVNNNGEGIARSRFIKSNTIDRILLPMPNQIVFEDSPAWNVEDLRTMGRFLPTLGNEFAKGDTTNAAETLSALAKSAIPEMLLGLAEQTNFFSSGQAISQGFNGKILNPYYEQIFKGIEPRTISFPYKLVPRNLTEQNTINSIIKRLRANALPNYSAQSLTDDFNVNQFNGLGDRWLTTPNIFDITFRTIDYNEIQYLPKLKPLVLTNISTNYTPDNSWQTHLTNENQVAPIAIELNLTFSETEIITAKEIENSNF